MTLVAVLVQKQAGESSGFSVPFPEVAGPFPAVLARAWQCDTARDSSEGQQQEQPEGVPSPLHLLQLRLDTNQGWGSHTKPRKDPRTDSRVSSGVPQPHPKPSQSQGLPHLGQEVMEGPWCWGWGQTGSALLGVSFPLSVELQRFVPSPALSSQPFKALSKPKLILLQQLPSRAV